MKKQIWAYFLIFTMCVTLLGGCKAPEQEESAVADSVVESTPSAGQTENSAPAQNQVGGSDKLEHTAGDSISAAAHDSAKLAWAGRIAKNTGLIATNNSMSGASVSTARPHTIMDQLMKTTNKDFDYVVLHGGVNDAWENAKVGSISEEYDPLFFDEDTYAGGLETLFYNAILFYGDQAAIGYLINFKAPACQHGTIRDMSAYNAVAKKICEKWGVTYLDMYDHEEITAKMEFTTTKNTRDYIHPNDGGYEVITPYIEKYMRTMTPCGEAVLKRVFEG